MSNDLISDLPNGPLDHYRRLASFNWKMMKTFLDPETIIEFKVSKFYF